MKANMTFPIYASNGVLAATLKVKKVYKVAIHTELNTYGADKINALINLDKKTVKLWGVMVERHISRNENYNPFKDIPAKQHIVTTSETPFSRVFSLGDEVEYGSYNFSYTGDITHIGPKTIRVEDGREVKVMKIQEFAWRNYKLNLEKLREEKANWLD